MAKEKSDERGLQDQIDLHEADIFDDPYPTGHDCVIFAHQRVIWSLEQNRRLLGKVFAALDAGGRVVIFNAFADDDGEGPLYAGLDNVYFATLPFKSRTTCPWSDYENWLRDCGFGGMARVSATSWTPHGVIEAYVPAVARRG